jgi:SOS regulatory protein LexA
MKFNYTLTQKQNEILSFIKQFAKEKNRLPILDEIAFETNTSKSNIHKHVRTLISKKVLSEAQGKQAYMLIEDENDTAQIPLLGIIAAGSPIEAIPNEETLDLKQFCGPDLYAQRIKGFSMIEAGINDADYVIIKKQQTAEAGQIIVAIVNDWEATLKYFYPKDDVIELRPANKDMKPQYHPADKVKIQGVLVSLFRNFS